ncbi:MAG: MoaD/ThiS family protein [Anaerolineales bacterium]|nr:MAG: MoaD/ThiS family protein [Anaerolineales bacterium]
MVRVQIPYHLRNLASVGAEVELAVEAPVTVERTLDALEAAYPMLRGTIRDHASKQRRAYLRYFACQEDISFAPTDVPLPTAIVEGREPFIVMGAIAGG